MVHLFYFGLPQVCHACASVEIKDDIYSKEIEGFVKDPKWVIFPRLSYQNHFKIVEMKQRLVKNFSALPITKS